MNPLIRVQIPTLRVTLIIIVVVIRMWYFSFSPTRPLTDSSI